MEAFLASKISTKTFYLKVLLCFLILYKFINNVLLNLLEFEVSFITYLMFILIIVYLIFYLFVPAWLKYYSFPKNIKHLFRDVTNIY
jgi:hypothetical protein